MTGVLRNNFLNSPDRQNVSPLLRHWALLSAAVGAIFRNPLRSGMVIVCIVAILSPLVTAIGICEGIKDQYAGILKEGADVYVTRDNYGSNAPIEMSVSERLMEIPGVTRVVPRIIGRAYAHGKFLAVFGISSTFMPRSIQMVEGRKPETRGDVIIGQRAAKHLNLKVGSRFVIGPNADQVFHVVGVFRSRFAIWNSDLLIMRFEDASDLFGMSGKATDLQVYTRPGYERIVDIIIRISEEDEQLTQPPLRVQTRELIGRYSQRGFNMKTGVFSGFYCLVLGLAIPGIGVISGFGLSDRRREIGVMKAVGWQTQEVLETVALENLMIGIVSVPLILLVSVAWIYIFNGAMIAKFFIAGTGTIIPFQVPAKIFPLGWLVAMMMALVVTMVGTIYSTWRAAAVPPSEVMKV